MTMILSWRVIVGTLGPNYEKQCGFRHYHANQIARPDTGGGSFDILIDGDTKIGLTAGQAKARCFDACHAAQDARDFVFSDPRR